ncbi:MAG: hypothetical protein K6B74_04335, partial [Ruminococcus sp.]|nr:hypothetical protein [Ruminococcus sp.]
KSKTKSLRKNFGEQEPKVLGRGCGGEPFFRRVSPTEAYGGDKPNRRKKSERFKHKIGNLEKSEQKRTGK